jgi:hypothetical protein
LPLAAEKTNNGGTIQARQKRVLTEDRIRFRSAAHAGGHKDQGKSKAGSQAT